MVDFQQRDTSRGLGSEDPDADTDPSETDDGETATSNEADAETHDNDESHDHHAHEPDEHDESHDHHAHDLDTVRAAVVTISSTRTREDDPAGDAIQSALESAGHELATRDVIRDDYDNVQAAVDALVGRDDVDVVITTGGTGVTPDDVTVEAVQPLFEKRLPGFGELFRQLSREEIGTQVIATRATAGIADGVPVFCLPGSEAAARLGTERIVVEQAGHLAGLARRE